MFETRWSRVRSIGLLDFSTSLKTTCWGWFALPIWKSGVSEISKSLLVLVVRSVSQSDSHWQTISVYSESCQCDWLRAWPVDIDSSWRDNQFLRPVAYAEVTRYSLKASIPSRFTWTPASSYLLLEFVMGRAFMWRWKSLVCPSLLRALPWRKDWVWFKRECAKRITRHRAHVWCAHDSDALIAQVHLLNAISSNSHFDMNSEEQVQVRPMSARDRGDYLPFSRRQVHAHRRVRPTRSCKPGTEHAQFVPRDWDDPLCWL